MTEYRGYTLCPVTDQWNNAVMWMVYDPTMKLVADMGHPDMAKRWIDALLEGAESDGDGVNS